jgi:hypothetical protein
MHWKKREGLAVCLAILMLGVIVPLQATSVQAGLPPGTYNTLKVTVFDDLTGVKFPIPHAKVVAEGEKGSVTVWANMKGVAKLDLRPGDYTITVSTRIPMFEEVEQELTMPDDDTEMIIVLPRIPGSVALKAGVFEATSGWSIEGAIIDVEDDEMEEWVGSERTDEEGQCEIEVNQYRTYKVIVEDGEYDKITKQVSVEDEDREITFYMFPK